MHLFDIKKTRTTSVHPQSDNTAFMLLIGKEMKLPINMMFGRPTNKYGKEFSCPEYVNELVKLIKLIDLV